MSRLAIPLAGAALAAGSAAAGPAACNLSPLARPLARTCPADGEVDRIEGPFAVVVTPGGDVVDCPAAGLHEGDVLRGGKVDRRATARLAADVARLRARLGNGDDGADLKL